MADLYKYATGLTVHKPIIKRGVVDFAVGADWAPVAGDVKVVIDGAVNGNIGTLPAAVAVGNGALWSIVLTAGEMTGKKIEVVIVDAATKAIEDTVFEFETFGNASAQYPMDFSDAVRMGLTALPNAAAEAAGGLFTRGTGAGQIKQSANGQIDTNVVTTVGVAEVARWTGTCRSDAANTLTSVALPAGTTLQQVHPGGCLEFTGGTGASQWLPVFSVTGAGGSTPVAAGPAGFSFASQANTVADGTTILKFHPAPGVVYAAISSDASGIVKADQVRLQGSDLTGSGTSADPTRKSGLSVADVS